MCADLSSRFGSLRISGLLPRPQGLFFFGCADILFAAGCLQNLGALLQFVSIAGPRALLLALSGRWLIEFVTILVHVFFPPELKVRAARSESAPASESVRLDSSFAWCRGDASCLRGLPRSLIALFSLSFRL